jgi:hypothetical protein
MIYFDTETCGLHGMAVLIQYAVDDGPVHMHHVWREPINETLDLIERLCDADVCGFNLAFDWFHICKLYTTLVSCPSLSAYPEDMVDEIAILEEKARFSNYCLKPRRACDLMLHARRGPYQSLMERDDIRIRRVPTPLAWDLAEELERRIKFDDIYFARAKDKLAPRWKVYDVRKPDGTINPDFKDVKLKFKASGGLKNLYRHAFKVQEPVRMFKDIEVPKEYWPDEFGYAPYALAVAPDYHKTGYWNRAWPMFINEHILHWYGNDPAQQYASDDVRYTRRLHQEHFNSPEPGDNDSELACSVAACRWKGYAIDIEGMKQYRELEHAKSTSLYLRVMNPNATDDEIEKMPKPREAKAPTPAQIKAYVSMVMDPTEQLIIQGSTKKVVLEEISKWLDDNGDKHPAAIRAQHALDSRQSKKKIELYDKLIHARRFHASFKVIGALSGRMSGADGLNPQGIDHNKKVRALFFLADREAIKISEAAGIEIEEAEKRTTILTGGDFKSFEVSLAAAVFNDPDLDKALSSGKKVHAIMGMALHPGTTYAEVVASDGTANDMYDKGKKGFFLKVYFGTAHTFNKKLGIPMEIAEKADRDFNKQFPNVKKFQDSVIERFTAISQPGGIGSAIYWKDPAEYAENALGFRRYFTLEIKIMRTLFEMAQRPPAKWKNIKLKVVRRERVQSAGGAVQSALYGAAFGIQSAMIRAAGNHFIQSYGAGITKDVQRAIWDIQPSGIHDWLVQPANIHDEIMNPTRRGYEQVVELKAQETVAKYKPKVPFIAIDWFTNISSWASKKGEPLDAPANTAVSV